MKPKDDTHAQRVASLLYALKAFVDYYEQAGIGDAEDTDEDDGFDDDERFNVRQARKAIADVESGQ